MCLAVCNKKLGGCGHIGDDQEWLRNKQSCICPVCQNDRMYFLHDYNLEAVVDRTRLENAKGMLDEYYAKLRGKSLHVAYKNGNIPPHRLTTQIKKEIGLA